jgi:ADP-heptose:LPS heptosyltransferase
MTTAAATRALFVELLGGMGDLIFALAALEALHRSAPATAWDVLTFPPGDELLAEDPRIHRVFRARRGLADDQPACRVDLQTLLDRQPYDLIVSDARHSGIPEVIERRGAGRCVTQLWSRTSPNEPIGRLFLRRLREEGLIAPTVPDGWPRVALTPTDRLVAAQVWDEVGQAPERTIVLNPHAGMPIKRWPPAAFAALGRALTAASWPVAVLAGDEPVLAASLAGAIPGAQVLPRLPLRVTAAALARAALLVSADSGIAHLAAAAGTPVVGLYGPTVAGRYGVAPPSRNLSSPFDCPERRPMDFTRQRCWYTGQCIFADKSTCCADLTPAAVLAAVQDLLAETGAAGGRLSPLPYGEGRTERHD